MRNDTGDQRSLDRKLNHQIKSIAKNPTQSLGRGSVFYRLIDLGTNKKESFSNMNIIDEKIKDELKNKTKSLPSGQKLTDARKDNPSRFLDRDKNKITFNMFPLKEIETDKKTQKDYDSSFLYSEKVMESLNRAKLLNFMNSLNHGPNDTTEIPESIPTLSKVNHTNINAMKSNSEDSRVTGGGIGEETKIKHPRLSNISEQPLDKHPITKKNSRELNTTRKCSFKIRNPSALHRKNVTTTKTVTTLTSSTVAALTQKYNEMIDKNDKLLKEPSFAKIVDKIQSNKNKNSDSNSSTPTSTLTSGVSIKIITSKKMSVRHKNSLKSKTPSNTSLDKINSADCSPIVYRRLLRVRSDTTPKKKKVLKKKSSVHGDNTAHSSISDESRNGDNNTKTTDFPTFHIKEVRKKQIVKRKPSFKTSPTRHSGTVRATIQKFESEKHNSSVKVNNSVSNIEKKINKISSLELKPHKPLVPEKKLHLSKTKNIVIHDGKPKIKAIKYNLEKKSLENTDKPILSKKQIKQSGSEEDTLRILNASDKTTSRKSDFFYDKMCIRQTFYGSKLQLKNIDIENLDANENDQSDKLDKADAEKSSGTLAPEIPDKKSQIILSIDSPNIPDENEKTVYQEITTKIIPNDSFLWRTYSKSDLLNSNAKEYDFTFIKPKDIVTEDLYELVGPPVELEKCDELTELNKSDSMECASFESIIKKTDDLLDSKKKSIADELTKCKYSPILSTSKIEAINLNVKTGDNIGIVEAINEQVISNLNISNEILTFDDDEDYEPLEPYRSEHRDSAQSFTSQNTVLLSTSHHKSNCPLPEVPSAKGHSDCESDDGYEYCKSPKINTDCNALILPAILNAGSDYSEKNCALSKSDSLASSIGYEKISSIYEKISAKPPTKTQSEEETCNDCSEVGINYDECNCDENIYDTIKHADNISVSNCYESIPGSPHSVVKLRQTDTKYQRQLLFKNRLSFDAISNFSQTGSIMSSDQKTNSIYGQRSIVSFGRSETIVYGNSPSEISSSDRSDEWVDISDQEQSSEDPTIIIVRDRAKGRRSPVSWTQKVRHQWNVSPKKWPASEVSVSSPSAVYIATSRVAAFYSDNDELYGASETYYNVDLVFRVIRKARVRPGDCAGLAVLKISVVNDDSTETQEATLLIDIESSDSDHHYESLSHAPADSPRLPTPFEDFDSFDSESESEQSFVHLHQPNSFLDINHARLPQPPSSSNIYTLTKFASVAGEKMRQLKRNFTKRTRKKQKDTEENKTLTVASADQILPNVHPVKPLRERSVSSSKENIKIKMDNYENLGSIQQEMLDLNASSSNNEIFFKNKLPESSESKPQTSTSTLTPSSHPIKCSTNLATSKFSLELNSILSDRKLKYSTHSTEPSNNVIYEDNKNSIRIDKELKREESRKPYLSFKSKFRRSISSKSSDDPSVLTVTNSTFYLNDCMDTDQGFYDKNEVSIESNNETRPTPPTRKHNKKSQQLKLESDSKIYADVETLSNNDINKKTSPVNQNKSLRHRPNDPPPPPPAMNSPAVELKSTTPLRRDGRSLSNTSWYAECGLFKATEPYKPETNGNNKEKTSSASWYAEVGLYQAGNISTSSGASSNLSGTGTCSTTTAPSPPSTPPPPIGRFNQEPLYQFYNASKVELICQDLGTDSDSDCYEKIANFTEGFTNDKLIQRPTAMQLITPHKGPSRTLWSEIPEVINSAILCSLTPTQKKKQEAMFEIITSEASYFNSLTVLESHLISHPSFQDGSILNNTDKKILFGNIFPVKKCSERLMSDLEACWQDNILLRGLCKIIKEHSEKYFGVYVKYCENQVYFEKTMKRLKLDTRFTEILSQLQSQPICQSLSLHSFLMLPMQRITRLPLLMDAVLKKLDTSDDEYQACLDALTNLNIVVSQCNEGARNTERLEEMMVISSQIEFPPNIKEISIRPQNNGKNLHALELSRWLIRSGTLTHLVWRGDEQSKLTFGKKYSKIPLYLFLFTDLLIITKKKSEESYVVVDYCKRSLLEMTSSDMMTQSPLKETAGKNIVLLTMLENCENKTIEMLLSCVSESDRQRWMEACLPPPSDNPDETIYEGWDCPQVTTAYAYHSTQPDELNLQQGDIVNVYKKMADGWYHGERIRDGEKGWFPGNYTVEIASPHVRARNLRQRYRLLALSGSYLGQKKKN